MEGLHTIIREKGIDTKHVASPNVLFLAPCEPIGDALVTILGPLQRSIFFSLYLALQVSVSRGESRFNCHYTGVTEGVCPSPTAIYQH